MKKYLLIAIVFAGCAGRNTSENSNRKDSILISDSKPLIQYDLLKTQFITSDSVVLLSHISPNEPYKDPKTGKYLNHSIPFIKNGKINYDSSVQERKQLNKQDIIELADILSLPAVDDGIGTMCFQPRNAVVVFKQNHMSYFDFCFECYGFSADGDFDSDLIMNTEKYQRLLSFYKKHRLKYELE